MKIAIIFGDNDYHSTFRGVLYALHGAYKYNLGSHKEDNFNDKDYVLDMINELSLGCNIAWQNSHNPDKNYLKITEDRLLLNEEVDKYLQENSDNNYATYVLDTDLDYENNDPIYSF